MKINKIKINNFKSIYDTFEIDFDDINGFWKISGPVGSGKTSIGEAIIFGLFGTVNGKNNSDLISWGQKHGMVELWCTSKNHNIYIKREMNMYGQSPVYVEVDNEEILFSNKRDAQIKLETEYYDTSKMILELLCIISFNNFKSLASLNTTDSKKFLDQVLGFQILTEYSNICKELRQENFNIMQSYKTSIKIHQSQIDKLRELINIEKIDGNINETKSKIQELKTKQSSIIKEKSEQLGHLSDNISKLKHELTTILTLGKNKAKEISFIEKGVCPTCGADIDKSHLNDKIKEREILLNQYNIVKADVDKHTDEYNKINSEATLEQNNINSEIRACEMLLVKLEEQSKASDVNIKQIKDIEDKINELNDLYTKAETDDIDWSELYNTVSTNIRYKILSSFIPILNDNIQKYAGLLRLPYIITFDESFKCNIEIYGVENKIPISSLSTGQLKIVDMVIILGFLGTILGNNGVNIIFLDELFSNLDENLRDDMCRLLKQTMSNNKTIFIISHQDINSQVFNGEINLKLENNNIFNKSLINIKYYGELQ